MPARKSDEIKQKNGNVITIEKKRNGKIRINLFFTYLKKSNLPSLETSATIKDVIKYPEKVKNISTPRKPPGNHDLNK